MTENIFFLFRHHNLGQNFHPALSSQSSKLEVKEMATVFSFPGGISGETEGIGEQDVQQ